jgi:hemolysin activation/secretion protein
VPLYRAGGVLGASYTRSTVVGNYGAFSATGAGQTMGLNYRHYLPAEGGYRGYVHLSLDDKRFDITEISGTPVPGQLVRRSRPLTVGYTARVDSDTAVWAYSVELAHNLSGGGGNNLAAYQSEDPRIGTSRFTALRANASHAGLLGAGWLWSARGQFQYSADALIAGEQFGLGGAGNVRGTTERPISGDRGLFASVEISTPELHPGLRLVGFVDAGWLRNNNPNATIKPASDHLAGAGLGLRYNQGLWAFSAEWARIVTGSVLANAANPAIPRAGNNRLHVNLSAQF